MDIDRQAVEVAQLSLYLKLLEEETTASARDYQLEFHETLLPPLGENIVCGNSLIGTDILEGQLFEPVEERKLNPMDFETRFPKIMKRGGFDAIVGNPPYIRIQTMQEYTPQSVTYFNQQYNSASKGNYDIYVVFVERGLSLLKSIGVMGYILPNKFFNSKYGESLRCTLTQGNHISQIVNFGCQQVFENATTYTCLLILAKSISSKVIVKDVTDLAAWRADGAGNCGILPAKAFGSGEWNIATGDNYTLRERLRTIGKPLGEVTDIFVGLQTSADKIYVIVDPREVEREILRPFLTTGKLEPYAPAKPSAWLIFPYKIVGGDAQLISQKTMRQKFPKTWSYFEKHEQALRNRDRGKMNGSQWYAFGRSQNLVEMDDSKLVIQVTAIHPTVILDNAGLCMTGGGAGPFYGIRPYKNSGLSLKYLIGIMNSHLFGWVVRGQSTPLRGGYIKYSKQYIETFSIPAPPDKARHDRIVTLVDQMLSAKQQLAAARSDADKDFYSNKCAGLDRQIDALVYELYGLTPEEITIVEGAGS